MKILERTSKEFLMTAPCGINCADCECFLAAGDPSLMAYLVSRGIEQSRLPCPGCREVKGMCPAIGQECETYRCAQKNGVPFCFACEEFPCERLTPAADRANVLPHNLKVYNLCFIQKKGLKQFAENSLDIKKKYFKGKMGIGRGPQAE